MQILSKLLVFLLLSTLVLNVGCAKKNAEDMDEDVAGLEVDGEEGDEMMEDVSEEELAMEDEDGDEMSEGGDDSAEMAAGPTVQEGAAGGEFGQYEVGQGETLMIVAYKVYGDYTKWRDIAEINGVSSETQLRAGMVLRYRSAWENPPQQPQGDSYVIQWGDTLGKISNGAYGTPSKWKAIWENNAQQIKDPNLIFAGFTIFIAPLGEEVAMNEM